MQAILGGIHTHALKTNQIYIHTYDYIHSLYNITIRKQKDGAWGELRQAEKIGFEFTLKDVKRFCLAEGEGESVPGRRSSKREGTETDSRKVNAGYFEEECVRGGAKRS